MAGSQFLEIDDRLKIPIREIRFSFVRSQGPGGQNVNKVNSKAVLKWLPERNESLPEDVRSRLIARFANRISRDGELSLTSQRYRDQGRNVADCLLRLQAMVREVAQPPKSRKPTRPTAGSRVRRHRAKRIVSEKKERRRPPRTDD